MRFTTPRRAVLASTLAIALLSSSQAWSEEESRDNDDLFADLSQPITSLPYLSSLKGIAETQHYQAPSIYSLKNEHQVRTLFAPTQGLPVVDIQLTFNAGSARDNTIRGELNGLASLTAQLLDEGTSKYNATQIAATFEMLGAQFSAQAYRDMFIVKLRVTADNQRLEPALSLLLEILKDTQFRQSNIDLILNNASVGQQQTKENPSRLLGIRFYRAVYGSHPYAAPTTGTQRTLSLIKPDDIQNFKNRYLVNNNLNIAITGQLTRDQATTIANAITRVLPQGEKAPPLAQPTPIQGQKVFHVPFDSSQSHVMMGHLGVTRNHPDRLALEVANTMLGGSGFNSLLMRELRVKRGYTYGAYSQFNFTQATGLFSLSYSTRNDHLIPSIRVTHQTLKNFVQQPIDLKALEDTKKGMLRAFPSSISSNAAINAQLGLIGFYGLPDDHLSQYPIQLQRLSAIDIQRAIQTYFKPDQLVTVIISPTLDKVQVQNILQSAPDTLPASQSNDPFIGLEPISSDDE